jgi:eukaryotic-like serine/threonine-protein kinase
MGEVYLALDVELDRQVALKVLLTEVADNEDRLRRFVQEAKAASALNHPNILTVYEIGHFESSRFIAAELVKGKTLHDRLRGEPFTCAKRWTWRGKLPLR